MPRRTKRNYRKCSKTRKYSRKNMRSYRKKTLKRKTNYRRKIYSKSKKGGAFLGPNDDKALGILKSVYKTYTLDLIEKKEKKSESKLNHKDIVQLIQNDWWTWSGGDPDKEKDSEEKEEKIQEKAEKVNRLNTLLQKIADNIPTAKDNIKTYRKNEYTIIYVLKTDDKIIGEPGNYRLALANGQVYNLKLGAVDNAKYENLKAFGAIIIQLKKKKDGTKILDAYPILLPVFEENYLENTKTKTEDSDKEKYYHLKSKSESEKGIYEFLDQVDVFKYKQGVKKQMIKLKDLGITKERYTFPLEITPDWGGKQEAEDENYYLLLNGSNGPYVVASENDLPQAHIEVS